MLANSDSFYVKTNTKTKLLNHAIAEVMTLKTARDHPFVVSLHNYVFEQTNSQLTVHLELDLMDYDLCSWTNSHYDPLHVPLIQKQLVLAVANLHAMHFAHLDIKPDNILVKCRPDQMVTVRLCDFEHARYCHPEYPDTSCDRHPFGTVLWNAPECFVSTRRDLYAIDTFATGLVLRTLQNREMPWTRRHECCRRDTIKVLSCAYLQCTTVAECNGLRKAFAFLLRKMPSDTPHMQLIESMSDFDPARRPTMAAVADAMCGQVLHVSLAGNFICIFTPSFSCGVFCTVCLHCVLTNFSKFHQNLLLPHPTHILDFVCTLPTPAAIIAYFTPLLTNRTTDNLVSVFWLFRNIPPIRIAKSPELIGFLDVLSAIAGSSRWAAVVFNEALFHIDCELSRAGSTLASPVLRKYLSANPTTIMPRWVEVPPSTASSPVAAAADPDAAATTPDVVTTSESNTATPSSDSPRPRPSCSTHHTPAKRSCNGLVKVASSEC
jgi:serine/threonine protein kinase